MAKAKSTPAAAKKKAPAKAPEPAPAPPAESASIKPGDQGSKIATFSGTFESDANLNADRFIESNAGKITVTNRSLSGPGDGQQVTVTINYEGDATQSD
tara:strand:- start:130 stop:426 length:297 start_codon:yes stop_codon:yes gene_type:complete